ncbi:MAG: YcxB family protein [Thermoguttaceae bacterium]|jgi:hypothetical protein
MDKPLRLEYACTPEEIKEAEGLLIRQNDGRGSQWLALILMLLFLAGVLLALYRAYLSIPTAYRGYALAGFLALFVIVYLQDRRRRSRRPTITVELDAHGVRMISAGNMAILPWSGFSNFVESSTVFGLVDRTSHSVYVFPKRAFPDQEACDWFQTIARSSFEANPPPADPPTQDMPEAGSVSAQFRLRYRDYLDRSLASWFTRGLMMFFGALIAGVFLYASQKPHPNAVYSDLQVFCYFGIPFIIIMAVMPVFVGATHAWFGHFRILVLQNVSLSEQGLSHTSVDGHAVISWQTPTCYKETPWSFILWWPGNTGAWMLLPKRAFSTLDAIDRCRQILSSHAKSSTWYFG